MTITQLVRQFQENEISAESQFRGRRCSITGQVSGIYTGTGDAWSVTLMESADKLERSSDVGSVFFNFTFGKDSIGSNLQKGQAVTCIGTFNKREGVVDNDFEFDGESIQPN